MIRKDKPNNATVSGFVAIMLMGSAVLGLTGCLGGSKTEPKTEATTNSEKPLLLTAEGAQPKAVITGGTIVPEGAEYDFGATEIGEEFTHVFQIKNEGDGTLELKKGPPSCTTCTSFEVDNLTLKPGETAKVTVKWQIKAEAPVFRQHVPLTTNLPKQDETAISSDIKLFVKGRVVQKLVLRPAERWDMGVVQEDQPLEFSATLYSAVVDKIDIVSMKAGKPQLTVKATPFTPEKLKELNAKCGYDLTAVLDNSVSLGEFSDKIAFNLRTPTEVTLNVDVVAKRNGPIQIYGPNWDEKHMTARLGSFDAAKDFSHRLNLYARGFSDELKFVAVDNSADPRFNVEIVPDPKFKGTVKDHRRYDLFIKYKGSNKDAAYPLKKPLVLIIKTNMPKHKEITLNIISQGMLRD